MNRRLSMNFQSAVQINPVGHNKNNDSEGVRLVGALKGLTGSFSEVQECSSPF